MKLILYIFLSFLYSEEVDAKPSDDQIVFMIHKLEQDSLLNSKDYYISNNTEGAIVHYIDLAFYYASKNDSIKVKKYGNSEDEIEIGQRLELDIPKSYKKRIFNKRRKARISQIRKVEDKYFVIISLFESQHHSYSILFIFNSNMEFEDYKVSEIVT